MRIHNRSFILWLLLLVATASSSLAAEAEYIWTENDFPGTTLYMSTYQNGAWGAKETILTDENFNILPALGSDSAGNHLAVWVTLIPRGGSVLRYSWQQGDGWTEPDILWDGFRENLAPVLLFDAADTPWVFWSANDGDDDDIYAASYKNGSWGHPKRIHSDNDVPDILPQAHLGQSGEIVVNWQQLGTDDLYRRMTVILGEGGRYVKSVFRDKSRTRKMLVTEKPADIPLPPYEGNSRSTLHFPGFKSKQSSVIRKRTDR